MKKNKSKKAYIEYLNGIYSPYQIFENFEYLIKNGYDKNLASQGRYGDLLRKNDPIAFNVGLNEFQD